MALPSRYKQLLLAGASSLALAQSALAADKPVTKAPPAVASWAGPYAGIHLGAAWHELEFRELAAPFFFPGVQGASLNQNGFIGGAQAGYNWQAQNYVFGLEADISWISGSGRTTAVGSGLNSEAFTKMDWLATFRARAGFVVNPLFYVTGGLAVASVTNTWLEVNGPPSGYRSDKVRTGYVVGVGAEHMYAANRTVRLELLYVDLGKVTDQPMLFGDPHYRSEFRNTAVIARGAFNLKF